MKFYWQLLVLAQLQLVVLQQLLQLELHVLVVLHAQLVVLVQLLLLLLSLPSSSPMVAKSNTSNVSVSSAASSSRSSTAGMCPPSRAIHPSTVPGSGGSRLAARWRAASGGGTRIRPVCR